MITLYKQRATFDCSFSGQKRAYADTVTEGKLYMECYSDYRSSATNQSGIGWAELDCSDEQAKNALRGLVSFKDNPRSPFDPVLRTFQKVAPGVWYVMVVRRYDD